MANSKFLQGKANMEATLSDKAFEDVFNYDRMLSLMMSRPCPHCKNHDPDKISNVTDHDDSIIALHCTLCDNYFGMDDYFSLSEIETLKDALDEGRIPTAKACEMCGNRDSNKFLIQSDPEDGYARLYCLKCMETDNADSIIDYEKNNKTRYIKVKDINDIRPGDHVTWKYGPFYLFHTIVESVQPELSTIVIHKFWLERVGKRICVMPKEIPVNCSKDNIYKVEYEKCHDPSTVLLRAQLSEGRAGYNIFSNKSSHFATWCKIGKHDPKINSLINRALYGKKRPLSHGKEKVKDVKELKSGDHIAWSRPLGYSHHAVVVDKSDSEMTIVQYAPALNAGTKGEIMKKTYDLGSDSLNLKNMYLFEYADEEDPIVVIGRALMCLGQRGYNFMANNCEHFVTFCKTGRIGSKQVEDFVRTIRKSMIKAAHGVAQRGLIRIGLQGLVEFVIADSLAMACGASAIAGIEGIRLGLAAKNLHKHKSQGKDIDEDVRKVSQRTGGLVLGTAGFILGEFLMPFGGGLIGGFIGSTLGEFLGIMVGQLINWIRHRENCTNECKK